MYNWDAWDYVIAVVIAAFVLKLLFGKSGGGGSSGGGGGRSYRLPTRRNRFDEDQFK